MVYVKVEHAPPPILSICTDDEAHADGSAAKTVRVLEAIDTLCAVNDRTWHAQLTAAQRGRVRKAAPQLYEFARWLHFDSRDAGE